MLVIAATMRQPITSSGSIRPARSAGSHRRSNANCGGAPPSNQSSVISRPSIAWAAIILHTMPAMPLTPCWPPPVITSISSSNGWSSCCIDSWRLKKQPPPFNESENRKLHGRQRRDAGGLRVPGSRADQIGDPLPANWILQDSIGYLLKHPVGRPAHHVRRCHASFSYQAGSWSQPRRVIAKVERRLLFITKNPNVGQVLQFAEDNIHSSG